MWYIVPNRFKARRDLQPLPHRAALKNLSCVVKATSISTQRRSLPIASLRPEELDGTLSFQPDPSVARHSHGGIPDDERRCSH